MNTSDLKTFLKTIPHKPGVYQMINAEGKIIYVGKAKDLKKRLSNYLRVEKSFDAKRIALVNEISTIEIIVTANENEALLLESNLIKKNYPKFNVSFRDDKSYPYIFISNHQDYPRIDFYRGTKKSDGEYFGPYYSSHRVRRTIQIIQKIFQIRTCTDTFFKNRSRPCILYQIKRCTAPCVNYIDVKNYQEYVRDAKMFLRGKSDLLIEKFIKQMQEASQQKAFELAAKYRDQIALLRDLQSEQVAIAKKASLDAFAIINIGSQYCVDVLFVRDGYLIGNRAYFPKVPSHTSDVEALTEFIEQFYLSQSHHIIPPLICVENPLEEKEWLEQTLTDISEHAVKIRIAKSTYEKNLIKLAKDNAMNQLRSHLEIDADYREKLQALCQHLQMPNLPTDIECFDVSHSSGEATYASCVVFNENGKNIKAYRRYLIKDLTPGDDYAALKQALTRRYQKISAKQENFPDIIIIDGGKGQLKQAADVLKELNIVDVIIIGIAKGPARKPGLEKIYVYPELHLLALASDDKALHLLQNIRDEAHRFALRSHQQKRAKARKHSFLETIPGIGAKRSRDLLNYFGGLSSLKKASIQEIAQIPGIGLSTAKEIYARLHQDQSS